MTRSWIVDGGAGFSFALVPGRNEVNLNGRSPHFTLNGVFSSPSHVDEVQFEHRGPGETEWEVLGEPLLNVASPVVRRVDFGAETFSGTHQYRALAYIPGETDPRYSGEVDVEVVNEAVFIIGLASDTDTADVSHASATVNFTATFTHPNILNVIQMERGIDGVWEAIGTQADNQASPYRFAETIPTSAAGGLRHYRARYKRQAVDGLSRTNTLPVNVIKDTAAAFSFAFAISPTHINIAVAAQRVEFTSTFNQAVHEIVYQSFADGAWGPSPLAPQVPGNPTSPSRLTGTWDTFQPAGTVRLRAAYRRRAGGPVAYSAERTLTVQTTAAFTISTALSAAAINVAAAERTVSLTATYANPSTLRHIVLQYSRVGGGAWTNVGTGATDRASPYTGSRVFPTSSEVGVHRLRMAYKENEADPYSYTVPESVTVSKSTLSASISGATAGRGNAVVRLTASVGGTATGTITYSWSTSAGTLSSTSGSTTDLTLPARGTARATLTVTRDGLTATDTHDIVVSAPATFTVTITGAVRANAGARVTLRATLGGTAVGNVAYSWTTIGGTLSSGTAAAPTVTLPSSGRAIVSLSATRGGVTATDTHTVLVRSLDILILNLPASVLYGSSHNIRVQVRGTAAGDVTYRWTATLGSLGSTLAALTSWRAPTTGTAAATITVTVTREGLTRTATVRTTPRLGAPAFTVATSHTGGYLAFTSDAGAYAVGHRVYEKILDTDPFFQIGGLNVAQQGMVFDITPSDVAHGSFTLRVDRTAPGLNTGSTTRRFNIVPEGAALDDVTYTFNVTGNQLVVTPTLPTGATGVYWTVVDPEGVVRWAEYLRGSPQLRYTNTLGLESATFTLRAEYRGDGAYRKSPDASRTVVFPD